MRKIFVCFAVLSVMLAAPAFAVTVTLTSSNFLLGDVVPGLPPGYNMAPGDLLTIHALASPGGTFDGWQQSIDGGPFIPLPGPADILISIPPGTTYDIVAVFSALTATADLTIQVNSGSLGTTVPAPGTYTNNVGEDVTVTAVPAPGSLLRNWAASEDGSTYDTFVAPNTLTLPMPDVDTWLRADFSAARSWTVATLGLGGATGNVNPEGTADYAEGSKISLSAAPGVNSEFLYWSITPDGGSEDTSSNALAIDYTVPASDGVITAVFAPRRTLTFDQVGNGSFTIQINGGRFVLATPVKGFVSTCNVPDGADISLAATGDSGWAFTSFTIGSTAYTTSPYAFTVTANTNIAVLFKATAVLTVEQAGTGDIAGTVDGDTLFTAPGDYDLFIGDQVVASATPTDGYDFVRWTLNGTGFIENPITFNVTSNSATLKAWFAAEGRTMHMLPASGTGTGATIPAANSDTVVTVGEAVVLKALPGADLFSRWLILGEDHYGVFDNGDGSNSYTLTVPGTTDAGPTTFNVQPIFLTFASAKHLLLSSSTGHGAVGPLADSWHEAGHAVEVTATPDSGYILKKWQIDDEGFDGIPDRDVYPPNYPADRNKTTITVNGDMNVYAVFVAERTVTISKSGSGSGNLYLDPGFTMPAPASITLADGDGGAVFAVPASGSVLEKWIINGSDVAPANPYIDAQVNENLTIEAVFSIGYTLTIGRNPDTGTSTSVSVSPSGLEGTNGLGVHTYVAGTSVTVLADPPALSKATDRFSDWTSSDPALDNSDVNPLAFVVNENKTLTANFGPYYAVDLRVNGNGSIKINDSTVSTPSVTEFPANSVLAIEAVADSGYAFTGWQAAEGSGLDSTTEAATTLTVAGDVTITAMFAELQYVLTLVVDPTGAGTVDGATSGQAFAPDDVVTLTAIANAGYRFSEWSPADAVSNPNAPVVDVTMDASKTITAKFVETRTLTMNVSPNGAGTVSPGTSSYVLNSSVNISAVANQGYRFVRWIGDVTDPDSQSTSIFLDANKSVTAEFAAQYLLTTEAQPVDAGTLELTPSGPYFDSGAEVEVLAVPADGWMLDTWYVDGVEVQANTGELTANPLLITMDSSHEVQALFRQGYMLTMEVDGDGTTLPAPGQHFYQKTPVQVVPVTAVPAEGWTFVRWADENGETVSEEGSFTLAVTESMTLRAIFVQTYNLTFSADPEEGGQVSVDPESVDGAYADGTQVALEATATDTELARFRFAEWEVTGNTGTLTIANTGALTVTMDEDKDVVAKFIRLYELTTTAEGGDVTVTPPSANNLYDAGSDVSVRAQADPGFRFTGWKVNGVAAGSQNPLAISIGSDTTVEALFAEQVTFEMRPIIPSNSAGVVSPAVGTQMVDYGQVLNLNASANVGWRFDHWSGDVNANTGSGSVSVTMNGDKWAQATFVKTATLSTSVQGQGSISVDPLGNVFDAGTAVTLTATPSDACFEFAGWSVGGEVVSTALEYAFTLNEDTDVIATFEPKKYNLTITTTGDVNGVVQGAQTGAYDCGTQLSLTASTTTPGVRWDYWMINGEIRREPTLTFTMSQDTTVEAGFLEAGNYTLTLHVDPPEAGTLDPAAGVVHTYLGGDEVSVSYEANAGWKFDHWEGDVAPGQETAAALTFVMNANKDITAVFVCALNEITFITPPDGARYFVKEGQTFPITLTSFTNCPSDTTEVNYFMDETLLGTGMQAPYEVTGLVNVGPDAIGRQIALRAYGALTKAAADTYLGQSTISFEDAEAAGVDADGNGVPDDPFQVLSATGDVLAYDLAGTMPGDPRVYVFAIEIGSGAKVEAEITDRITVVETTSPERRVTVDIPAGLVAAGERGIALVMVSESLDSLVGAEDVANIPADRIGTGTFDNGLYAEVTVLISANDGASYAEIDPLRLYENPLGLTMSGMEFPAVAEYPRIRTLDTAVTKEGSAGSELSIIDGAAWESMVATQVADSIYQSYALYMTLNNVSVVSPMYIIPQDTPIADFAADKTTGPAPLTVNFTDQSVPGTGQEITSWAWEFGDGATSTDPNPTHEYTVPGLYPVSLTVVTPVGENTITKDDYIYVTIGSEGPTAAIYAEPIDGLTIQYDDLSTPGAAAITGWAWSFGDSVGTSTEKTGQYTYGADGTYEVTLTVTDANGLTDTASKFVTVSEVPVEGQPLEGQPLEGQPLEGQPLEGQPLEGQPLEGQPLEGQPLEGQPLEGQPAEGQPAEGQPAEGQPAEGQPAEGQPAEGQPAEGQAPVEGQAGTDGEAPAEGDVPAPSDNGCAGCSGGTISAGGGFGSGGNGGNLMLFALAGVVLALSSRKPEKSQVELS